MELQRELHHLRPWTLECVRDAREQVLRLLLHEVARREVFLHDGKWELEPDCALPSQDAKVEQSFEHGARTSRVQRNTGNSFPDVTLRRSNFLLLQALEGERFGNRPQEDTIIIMRW